MFIKSWKVYGSDGHRQKMSFYDSCHYDWSRPGDMRTFEALAEDRTGTNDFVVINITRNNELFCEDEFWGQISDGFFENSRTGKITELKQFKVSFRYSESVWCTNLCAAENKDEVIRAYSSKYKNELYVTEATGSDMYEAVVKSMPHTVIINDEII